MATTIPPRGQIYSYRNHAAPDLPRLPTSPVLQGTMGYLSPFYPLSSYLPRLYQQTLSCSVIALATRMT